MWRKVNLQYIGYYAVYCSTWLIYTNICIYRTRIHVQAWIIQHISTGMETVWSGLCSYLPSTSRPTPYVVCHVNGATPTVTTDIRGTSQQLLPGSFWSLQRFGGLTCLVIEISFCAKSRSVQSLKHLNICKLAQNLSTVTVWLRVVLRLVLVTVILPDGSHERCVGRFHFKVRSVWEVFCFIFILLLYT